MPVVVGPNGKLFRPYVYNNEDAFEREVIAQSDSIFGADTIYVDVKKRMSGNDIVTIPDGYVIDMTESAEPKLFVIENEIVKHDPFRHIGIQMLKFVTSFEGAHVAVRRFIMDDIAKDPMKLKRLTAGCDRSDSRNIDNYLDQAVFGPFRGIVVIDEAVQSFTRFLRRSMPIFP
jgi:hypothetical protein